VFTSAVFFLIFFSVNKTEEAFKFVDENGAISQQGRDSLLQKAEKDLRKDTGDTNLQKRIALLKDTSRTISYLDLLPFEKDYTVVSTIGYKYKDRRQYDSIQHARPPEEKDGWLKSTWNKRAIYLNEKYRREKSLSLENFSDILLHKLPYLLFVSLPFFALILKMLYIRRRKAYYFSDHGIFSIHQYILSFILLLFIFLWDKLDDMTGWGLWGVLTALTILAWPVHLFLAMKRFYRQNGFKTFVKFILLNILGFLLMLVLLIFFFLFSIFQL
jgi:hypothetical protein